ncbi:peptide chain release factor N(5)-glutamine methyltransferase [Corynebacterium sp. H78]|uniref:peptide chain release factor N(5)-glutamine methyltransferase n=1 Tax=Corynebacterium sp. H78 TaxID=3133417 RepID=UPI003096DF85
MMPSAQSDWKLSKTISTLTIGELLEDITSRLAASGCASPRTDAEQLMCHVSGRSRFDLLLSRRDVLTDDDPLIQQLPVLVARREAREPLQHILGTAPMCALELDVGPGVFIPRPETELLAEWVVGEARRISAAQKKAASGAEGSVGKLRIVDLCTGSGALALAIADAVPDAEIFAVELDERALVWTKRNLDKCQKLWHDRGEPVRDIEIRQGDATDPDVLADIAGTVDIVVSNPPYVPDSTEVSPEVHADPRHAVFGGSDGLDVIRLMMNVVRGLLRRGGVIGIEHDDDSRIDIADVFGNDGEWEWVLCHQDLAGRDRFTTAVYS